MGDVDPARGLPPRLAGRFRLLGVLRRGPGTVDHRAHDDLLDRPAVVTVARLDPARADLLTRAAGLDHPHLVPVIDLEVEVEVEETTTPTARASVVTDPSDGGDLGRRLAAGPLAVVDVLVCGAAVADALHHVHRAGLAHLAVGPGTVLFDEEGRARLGGTGLALARPGSAGTGPAGAAADVLDLGTLLADALPAGSVPPRGVRRLLRRMTDDSPDARPAADEVATALRHAALALTAAPAGTPRRTARVPRGVVAAAAVAVAALLAGTVAVVVTSPVEDVAADGPGEPRPALAAPAAPGVAGPAGDGGAAAVTPGGTPGASVTAGTSGRGSDDGRDGGSTSGAPRADVAATEDARGPQPSAGPASSAPTTPTTPDPSTTAPGPIATPSGPTSTPPSASSPAPTSTPAPAADPGTGTPAGGADAPAPPASPRGLVGRLLAAARGAL